ncbi:MAG: hypothetical protein QNJ94_14590 [Alphaproteobacteria bacterium]|nr:hypothetical protein [Alphaproteobacteria bacterium]
MKTTLSVLFVTGLVFAAAPAAAAELVMQNETPDRLTLFVNDKRACVAEPRKECTAQVERGLVNLRATAPDGRSIYDRLTIEDAVMIWSVKYYQPTSSGPGEAPPSGQ